MGLLEAALGSLAGEGQATALIGGEAGIGKTRLADEVCARARDRGFLVARGSCSPVGGRRQPFGPVVGMLRELEAEAADLGVTRPLEPLGHGLGLVAWGPVESNGDPFAPLAGKMAKTTLFDHVRTALAGVAGRCPVVLVLEDLHWADSSSIELIDFLARSLRAAPVLLIGTYREDELEADHPLRPVLVELGRQHRVSRLHLEGLGEEAITSLIAGVLGVAPAPERAKAVFARSAGNPFFAEEIARAGDLPGVPKQINELILLRVGRMSPEAQQVLRLLATIGDAIDHDLASAACQAAGLALDRALKEAVARRMVVVDQGRYRFRHPLVREAISGSLLPGESQRVHRLVAECLARTGGEARELAQRAAQLAEHWWAAASWPEALNASVAAAWAAGAVFAFSEGLGHLERALSVWERVPDAAAIAGMDHATLLGLAADAAYFASSSPRGAELARAAAEKIDGVREPGRAALGWAKVGRNCFPINLDASARAFDRALSFLPAGTPSAERARVLAEKAAALACLSRFAEGEATARQAISEATAVGARAEEGHALVTLGSCSTSLGRLAEGVRWTQEGVAIVEEQALANDLNYGYTSLSYALFAAGRMEEAAAVTLDAMAVGEELCGIRLEGAALNSIEALLQVGRWEEAEAMLAERGHVQGPCGYGWFELVSAMAALRRGRYVDAKRGLVAADRWTAVQDDVQIRGWYYRLVAELALDENRWAEAFDPLDRALDLGASSEDEVNRPEMHALAARAIADQHGATPRRPGWENRLEKARAAANGHTTESDRLVRAPLARGGQILPMPWAFALTCQAEESRLHGNDAAPWEAAARAWDALPCPYQATYCRWRQAEALLAHPGGRGPAAEVLALAWQTARHLGAEGLAARIQLLARRARLVLPKAADPAEGHSVASDLGLTAREVEVLELLAGGATDATIAERLFISKKTASVHVSNVLRKLCVSSRYEAAAVGQQAGLGA